MQSFITFIFTIIATAFGAFLTAFIQQRNRRPELCFEFVGVGNPLEPEEDEIGCTKPAYLAVEVFNIGGSPAMLASTFRIDYVKDGEYQLVCDVIWDEEERVIMPYEKKTHYLEIQDIKNLVYFDEKAGIDEFYITAYQMGKRKPIKSKLDVNPLPGHLTRHAAEDAIVQ